MTISKQWEQSTQYGFSLLGPTAQLETDYLDLGTTVLQSCKFSTPEILKNEGNVQQEGIN